VCEFDEAVAASQEGAYRILLPRRGRRGLPECVPQTWCHPHWLTARNGSVTATVHALGEDDEKYVFVTYEQRYPISRLVRFDAN